MDSQQEYLINRVYDTTVRKLDLLDYRHDCGITDFYKRTSVLALKKDSLNGKALAQCTSREICRALIDENKETEDYLKENKHLDGITATDPKLREIINSLENLKKLDELKKHQVLPAARKVIDAIKHNWPYNKRLVRAVQKQFNF
ncbi:hypothetical protein JW851_00205 [Candidatus Woesearchaeota archaeon]|nr:hypothetical protein [Candidatus Woesearchaeota archaeon]